jgi:hypothetical protein
LELHIPFYHFSKNSIDDENKIVLYMLKLMVFNNKFEVQQNINNERKVFDYEKGV